MEKLNITYNVTRNGKTDGKRIKLPISKARYRELLRGISTQNKAWQSVREILVQLTYLQGYGELGEWSMELEIQTEE